MKNFIWTAMFFCCFVIAGCASSPKVGEIKVAGNDDLCGLIVDEENVPVGNFVIRCYVKKGKKLRLCGSSITNSNGIFVMQNVPFGKCFISGEKSGWAKITEEPYEFYSRDELFCCKVNSFESAVAAAENRMKCQDFEGALGLLEGIYCQKDSEEEGAVLMFEAYACFMAEEKERGLCCLEKLEKNPYVNPFEKKSEAVAALAERLGGLTDEKL